MDTIQGQKAGLASGEARRERVRDRDREMALERERLPGANTYAALGKRYGLTRDGARKAVRRARSDPAIRGELEAARLDREASRKKILAQLSDLGVVHGVVCPHCGMMT